DTRVTALALRVVEEGYQRALLTTVFAAEDAEAALVGIALTCVALDCAQLVAELLATPSDHRVIGIDHTLVRSHVDARGHDVQTPIEAGVGKERHASLSCPLLADPIG